MFIYNPQKVGGLTAKGKHKIWCYHCCGLHDPKQMLKKNLKTHTTIKHQGCAPCWSFTIVNSQKIDIFEGLSIEKCQKTAKN
jgi:hypothetical protein